VIASLRSDNTLCFLTETRSVVLGREPETVHILHEFNARTVDGNITGEYNLINNYLKDVKLSWRNVII